jgi:hypothetical protein
MRFVTQSQRLTPAASASQRVIDWTVSLPFQRDLSEVGSIGHPKWP